MAEAPETTARIEALEIRIAHQDHTIGELNEMVTEQWKQIERLTRKLAKFEEQLQEAIETRPGSTQPEPPPPHY